MGIWIAAQLEIRKKYFSQQVFRPHICHVLAKKEAHGPASAASAAARTAAARTAAAAAAAAAGHAGRAGAV
jgi:hypothetical protein